MRSFSNALTTSHSFANVANGWFLLRNKLTARMSAQILTRTPLFHSPSMRCSGQISRLHVSAGSGKTGCKLSFVLSITMVVFVLAATDIGRKRTAEIPLTGRAFLMAIVTYTGVTATVYCGYPREIGLGGFYRSRTAARAGSGAWNARGPYRTALRG